MNIYNSQKDYWNDAALEKKFTTPFQMDLFCRYVPSNATILDMGCGYGRTLNELYEKGYQSLRGIDFSSEMIKRGLTQYPHLDIKQHSHTELPYADGSFDAVILLAVLTCIVEDKTQENLIQELRRILKKGGVLYINDFLLNHDERNRNRYQLFEKKYGQYGVFELPEGALLRHFEASRINELTREFKPIVFEKTVYKTMNGNMSNGFYYLGKKAG